METEVLVQRYDDRGRIVSAGLYRHMMLVDLKAQLENEWWNASHPTDVPIVRVVLDLALPPRLNRG